MSEAGDFGTWLAGMEAALEGEAEADVPCDGCTACCTASQFVHVGPDEADTLAHIPKALLFPAPMMPKGHLLLGYDEHGRCPMLTDSGCSIYAHRPRTCRTYDCRVFPAAGVFDDDAAKADVTTRARRWRFDYTSADGQTRHEAVQAAARFLRDHPDVVPGGSPPPTQLAVLAIEAHRAFLASDATGALAPATPGPSEVRVELRRRGAGPHR